MVVNELERLNVDQKVAGVFTQKMPTRSAPAIFGCESSMRVLAGAEFAHAG
jgi:hypothetical protein